VSLPNEIQSVLPDEAGSPDPRVRPPVALVCDHRGEGTLERVHALIEDGWQLLASGTLQHSLDALGRERPQLVVLDPLARRGAVELRALSAACGGAPFLYVGDPADPAPGIAAAEELGASVWDLLYRDAPAAELRMRVRRLGYHARCERERERWRHRACHDDRTDLLRPSVFEMRAVEHFSAARRHGHELGLVVVDLDGFGAINKAHDHTVGDRLIERVGEIIRDGLRSEDVAGRLGGDEFGVLLPYTGRLETAQVVGRLRGAIASVSVRPGEATEEHGRVAVTASLGFETSDGTDLPDVGALRSHAEEALRVAKQRGGDRAVYYRTMRGPVAEPGLALAE
jgi:diguanylate cyclase (GGDEF)-like protein